MPNMAHRAFTLAEVLIAIALLGVIAAFTIPKVMQVSGSRQYESITKEDLGTITGAFEALKADGRLTPATSILDVMGYINHLGRDTTSTIDSEPPTNGNYSCALGAYCYKMSNGSIIWFGAPFQFRKLPTDSVTNGPNYGLIFGIDPNGSKADPTPNSSEKSVTMFLYYTGQIRTSGRRLPTTSYYNPSSDTQDSGPAIVPDNWATLYDPAWLQF